MFTCLIYPFSALTLLVGWREGQLSWNNQTSHQHSTEVPVCETWGAQSV